jgi:two-component system, response regulator PdtaR
MQLEQASGAPSARPTVLVVEDEALIRRSIAEELRGQCWRVLEAETGDKARLMLVAGEPIDLVFSDVQMPGGMDGIQLAHWIHANHPAIHMMLTSSVAAMAGIPHEICAQGSIFRKPYESQAIAARIHVLLA